MAEDAAIAGTEVEPWPQEVAGELLLKGIAGLLSRFVVLPKWAEEGLALWALHRYAFELRDVTTYIGIESPKIGCREAVSMELDCWMNGLLDWRTARFVRRRN